MRYFSGGKIIVGNQILQPRFHDEEKKLYLSLKKKKKICVLNKEAYSVAKDEKIDRKAKVW